MAQRHFHVDGIVLGQQHAAASARARPTGWRRRGCVQWHWMAAGVAGPRSARWLRLSVTGESGSRTGRIQPGRLDQLVGHACRLAPLHGVGRAACSVLSSSKRSGLKVGSAAAGRLLMLAARARPLVRGNSMSSRATAYGRMTVSGLMRPRAACLSQSLARAGAVADDVPGWLSCRSSTARRGEVVVDDQGAYSLVVFRLEGKVGSSTVDPPLIEIYFEPEDRALR